MKSLLTFALMFTLLNVTISQSLSFTVDVKITGSEAKELAAIRQLYRLPVDQRTNNAIAYPAKIENPLFTVNTVTGEVDLKIYNQQISEPKVLGEAYDRATGTHKFWYTYGTCEEQPEYEILLYERQGETYISVTHCGEKTLVMGNFYLAKIFDPWQPRQTYSQ